MFTIQHHLAFECQTGKQILLEEYNVLLIKTEEVVLKVGEEYEFVQYFAGQPPPTPGTSIKQKSK